MHKSLFPLIVLLSAALWRMPVHASLRQPPDLGLPGPVLTMKLQAFVQLSAKELSVQTGKGMKLRDRIAFSLLKKDMRRTLKKNPDMTVAQYLLTAEKRKNDLLILILALLLMGLLLFIASAINFGQ